jgi:hypothetical protein
VCTERSPKRFQQDLGHHGQRVHPARGRRDDVVSHGVVTVVVGAVDQHRVGPSADALMITLRAPPPMMCSRALAPLRNRPVASMTTSTPASAHGMRPAAIR